MFSLITFTVTSLLIIVSFLVFPVITIKNLKFQSYWIIALLGAIVVLLSGEISFNELGANLFANVAMNPIKLVTLFLSMTVLSIYLDEIGFFAYVAAIILKKSGASQWRIFFALYFTVATLTLFTSNDIIVLTLTLFIIYFAKNAKINPIPYLIAQFVAANTASVMFIIGNPTNMYLGTKLGLSFIGYFQVLALPTLAIIVVSLFLLIALFYNQLKKPIDYVEVKTPQLNRLPVTVGLVHLGVTIVLLVISNYIAVEMWIITLVLAISLTIAAIFINTKKQILNTYKRVPYTFVPFLLSMFVLVLALNKAGITHSFSQFLGEANAVFTYGFSSTLFGNLMNNIPMSIFYGGIIESAATSITLKAGYASIIGSNLAALISPLGSLAGLMWMQLLKKEGVHLSFFDFLWRGLIIGTFSLGAGLIVLNFII